jgi:hypothetical protein
MLQDHSIHGGHSKKCGGLIPGNVVEHSIEVNPGQQDHAVSIKQSGQSNPLTKDVIKRASLDNDIIQLKSAFGS